jgi:hypothetical protein
MVQPHTMERNSPSLKGIRCMSPTVT